MDLKGKKFSLTDGCRTVEVSTDLYPASAVVCFKLFGIHNTCKQSFHSASRATNFLPITQMLPTCQQYMSSVVIQGYAYSKGYFRRREGTEQKWCTQLKADWLGKKHPFNGEAQSRPTQPSFHIKAAEERANP